MRLGTSTGTFSHMHGVAGELPLDDVIRLCSRAGFEVLDIDFGRAVRSSENSVIARDDWKSEICEIGELAESLGMKFSRSHGPYLTNFYIKGSEPTEEEKLHFRKITSRAIEASAMLGVEWMTVHTVCDTLNTEYGDERQLATNYEFFAPTVELAKKAGVGIAIENMFDVRPATINRFFSASPDDQIAIIDMFNDEAVGACWDLGHANLALRDQSAVLRRLGKRLKTVHAHDNYGQTDSHHIPFVGGDVAWEDIMRTLKEIGYCGDFLLECRTFMKNIPQELREQAAVFAARVGRYCIDMYNA